MLYTIKQSIDLADWTTPTPIVHPRNTLTDDALHVETIAIPAGGKLFLRLAVEE